MKEVVLVIGLPGSGKTVLLDYYKKHPLIDYVIYDDWMEWTVDVDREKDFKDDVRYDELIDDIKKGNTAVISSVNFCSPKELLNAEYYLKLEFNEIKIQRIYFENNLENSILNIEYRDRKNGGRWEKNDKGEDWYYGTIYNGKPLYLKEIENSKNLSEKYIIPYGYNVLSIKKQIFES